ncbi:MAG: thymidine phosphorylase [Chloroflexi bacterium]|nr:thymidine phosphorylase [Chloroflexota bacterium]
MRIVDLITKKRDGGEFSREEIEYFIREFTAGNIPDYQAAAWLMAVYFQGMSHRETTDLTLAMAHSGDLLDLSGVVPFEVDKHSTGGVGDKTTLVVEPLVAACGVPVGKMSGRGLGYSGGTIDKLEAIPGFRVSLTTEEFIAQLREVGVVLCGQSADLAPADGKLYALRDVTGTVPSIPLIASSVMSKKIAAGSRAIVLDVKCGLGAFMQTLKDATQLAETMVAIGKLAKRKTVALIADMNQPLGSAVGNALEVREAIATLNGGGPADFREHCLTLATHMLLLAKVARTPKAARALLEAAIAERRGLETFKALVKAQGGDVAVVENADLLPHASLVETVPTPRSGYLAQVHAAEVGMASVSLGAGREKKGEPIDLSVGVEILHKVGDRVKKGEPLFVVHANDAAKLAEAKERILAAHRWSGARVKPLPQFYKTIV